MQTVKTFMNADRYLYDFKLCTIARGFAQVDTDQDAWYFGTWANPERRLIVTYCEGDVTKRTAETDAEFSAEIRGIKQWNEDQGHRFKGIDPGFNEALKARFVTVGLGDLLH